MTACWRLLRVEVPGWPRLFPLYGLRASRYRREDAVPPSPRGSGIAPDVGQQVVTPFAECFPSPAHRQFRKNESHPPAVLAATFPRAAAGRASVAADEHRAGQPTLRQHRGVGGRSGGALRRPARSPRAHPLRDAVLLVAAAPSPPAWPTGASCRLALSSPLPALLPRPPDGSTPGMELFDDPPVRPAKGPATATN